MSSGPTGPQAHAPDDFWAEREVTGGGVIVRAHGAIDYATVNAVGVQLDEADALLAPPAVLVLDLTDLGFLGSAGLALLVHYDLLCRDRGNQFRIVAISRTVLRPIALTGLGDILTVVSTADGAITTS